MESTTIKKISQRIKSKAAQSIFPLKQSLEQRKLQVMNRSLTPFKSTSIPLPPNTLDKAMRDHAPNHNSSVLAKLAWPAS